MGPGAHRRLGEGALGSSGGTEWNPRALLVAMWSTIYVYFSTIKFRIVLFAAAHVFLMCVTGGVFLFHNGETCGYIHVAR